MTSLQSCRDAFPDMLTGLASPRSLSCGVFEARSQTRVDTKQQYEEVRPDSSSGNYYCQTRLEGLDLSQPTWGGGGGGLLRSLEWLEVSLCLRPLLPGTMLQSLLWGLGSMILLSSYLWLSDISQ